MYTVKRKHKNIFKNSFFKLKHQIMTVISVEESRDGQGEKIGVKDSLHLCYIISHV